MRSDVSVVLSTYNRADLLSRSFHGYSTQSFGGRVELIVVDDDSTDETGELLHRWSDRLDIKHIRVRKPAGTSWRDCASTLNIGIRAANGNVIAISHPEVIPGRRSLEQIYDRSERWIYTCCKGYYLSQPDQQLIDTVPWQENLLAIRGLPGFSTEEITDDPSNEYSYTAISRYVVFESLLFGSLTRETWKEIGGLTEFETWGSIDVDFLHRRRVLGMRNRTLLHPETICVHQNHDVPGNVQTPRDMETCLAAVPAYPDRQSAIRDHLW